MIENLKALTEEEWLIVFLQSKVNIDFRDLAADPPLDHETLDDIGVGPSNLKRFLIPTFNNFFRNPKGRGALGQDGVKVTTTYGKLKELLL